MKSLFMALFAVLVSSTAVANVNTANETVSPRVNEIKSTMIQGFEKALERSLTLEERDSVVSFATTSALLENQLNSQVATNNQEQPDFTTVLLCLGAKGAAFGKFGGSLCMSTAADIYMVGSVQIGLAMGFAGTATVMIHKGPLGSLKGIYGGGTGSWNSGDIAKTIGATAVKGIFRLFGPELDFLIHRDNGSALGVFGLNIGPMIDISVGILAIR